MPGTVSKGAAPEARVYLVGAGISIEAPSVVMAAGQLLETLFRWIPDVWRAAKSRLDG
jgi:hypothetical protein